MLKKVLLLTFAVSLNASETVDKWNQRNAGYSYKKVAVYCAVGAGGTTAAVLLAPYVLPAGTMLAIKTALVAGATKTTTAIAGASVTTKISAGISIGRLGVKCAYTGKEEKLKELLKAEEQDFAYAREEFSQCLSQNSAATERNSLDIPTKCDEWAMIFALCHHEPINN